MSWKSTYKSNKAAGLSFKVGESFDNHFNGKLRTLATYDSNGNLLDYQNYNDKGQLREEFEIVYKSGKSAFKRGKTYTDSGRLASIYLYKNDTLLENTHYKNWGVWITNNYDTISHNYIHKEFFDNEKIKLDRLTNNILNYIKEKKFNKNGKQIFQEEKLQNKVIGHNFSYDESGKLEFEKFFNNQGIPIKIHQLNGGKHIIHYDDNGKIIKEEK